MNHAIKPQKHNNGLDALAIAVKYWVDQMAADADVKIRDRSDKLFDMDDSEFFKKKFLRTYI